MFSRRVSSQEGKKTLSNKQMCTTAQDVYSLRRRIQVELRHNIRQKFTKDDRRSANSIPNLFKVKTFHQMLEAKTGSLQV